jgi:hypothetical protein
MSAHVVDASVAVKRMHWQEQVYEQAKSVPTRGSAPTTLAAANRLEQEKGDCDSVGRAYIVRNSHVRSRVLDIHIPRNIAGIPVSCISIMDANTRVDVWRLVVRVCMYRTRLPRRLAYRAR